MSSASVYQSKPEETRPGRGFGVALVSYLILSLQQPLGWSMPLWIALAFFVVPGLIGLAIGRASVAAHAAGAAFQIASMSMLVYAAANMVRVHARLPMSDSPATTLFVGLVVSVAFAFAAGAVAACVAGGLSAMRRGTPK